MNDFVVEDCIFIDDVHCSPACELIQAGVDALNAAGAPLPAALVEWSAHMERIRAWEARRAAERTGAPTND